MKPISSLIDRQKSTNHQLEGNTFELAERACNSRSLQALLNATLAVDTFFLLSGLLAVTGFLRSCPEARVHLFGSSSTSVPASRQPNDKQLADSTSASSSSSASARSTNFSTNAKTKAKHQTVLPASFKPLTWMLARYGRLTPAYLFTIGLAVLLPALGSGPFWPETAGQVGTSCRSNWWLNLLYVNNFVQSDRACLIHSWYLSNDFQFSMLALLLFGLLFASKKLACILLISIFAASSATTFAVTSVNSFPPTIVATAPASADRWLYIHALYYKPWPHLPAYLIGMLTGCLVELRPQMGAGWRLLGWLLSSLVAASLLHSIYPWNLGLDVEPTLAALHAAAFRTLWACCIAWLIYGLTSPLIATSSKRKTNDTPAGTSQKQNNHQNNRRQPALAKLLAWRGFEVSSRLTYCAYLLHPLIIYHNSGTAREGLDSSSYGCLMRFLSQLVLTYMLSACLALLVELPSSRVLQLMHVARTACQRDTRDGQTFAGDSSSNSSPSSSTSCTSMRLAILLDHQRRQLVTLAGKQPDAAKLSAAVVGSSANCETMCSIDLQSCMSPPTIANNKTSSSSPVDAEQLTGRQPPLPPSSSARVTQQVPRDGEFQKRLAQAIGRGFRLRSRMAAESCVKTTGQLQQHGMTPFVVVSPATIGKQTLRSQASSCDLYVARHASSRPKLSTFANNQQQQQLPDEENEDDQRDQNAI